MCALADNILKLASSEEGQRVLSQEWQRKTRAFHFFKKCTKNTECKSLLI